MLTITAKATFNVQLVIDPALISPNSSLSEIVDRAAQQARQQLVQTLGVSGVVVDTPTVTSIALESSVDPAPEVLDSVKVTTPRTTPLVDESQR